MRNQLAEKSAEARSFEDRLAKQMVASESLRQQLQALQETELVRRLADTTGDG
jgi:hypothetical protein